jgi:hypothetical protein
MSWADERSLGLLVESKFIMENEADTDAPEVKDDAPKAPLSRRDFLRRAGKDVAEKGLEMTPGNMVAKTILGDEKKGEAPIWTRFANWRKNKEQEKTEKEEHEQDKPDTE